jgi:translocation and assembly module TamA
VARLRYALIACAAFPCLMALSVAPARAADVPKAAVQGQDLPPDLRKALEVAVGTAKAAPASRLEARRRAEGAVADAVAVLRSEGYYDYEVTSDVSDGDPGRPFITVTPGKRYTIVNPHIQWVGTPPPAGAQGGGYSAIQLDTGAPARAPDIVGAEGRATASIQKLGYADAVTQPREVIVDHATDTVQPEYRIDAGDLVHLDGIDLRTRGRTNPAWVRQLSPWKEGSIYDPEAVAELERRLLDAGVYDSVTVSLAPKDHVNDLGNRPVVVSLAEKSGSLLELGASYATTEGAGVDAKLTNFNTLGLADTITTTFNFAQIEKKLGSELALPDWQVANDTLKLGSSVYREVTDAYDEDGVNLHTDITRRYAKTSFRTYGLSLDVTRTDQRAPQPEELDLVTLTALGALTWDHSDDALDPKHGWRFDGRAEPAYAIGDISQPYLRLQAQFSGYLPLTTSASTVIATRFKVGSIVGGSVDSIPAPNRFYSGGGGSVRGYPYQGVGPQLSDGTPIGGVSIFEASFELRQKLTQKWGVVAFLDAGGIGASAAPDFSNVSAGVGLGVRYNLGFGPIRVDLATPLNRQTNDPALQVYLSIGQSF